MANTTTEILTVNGVTLNTFAKNVETISGRLQTPNKRTGNVIVPGRHGVVRTQGKKFAEGRLVLRMWVLGADDDGAIPGGSSARREFRKRVDELTNLFVGSDSLLDVRQTQPDGSVRQCFAECLDIIDFSSQGTNDMAKFAVALEIPDAFWQDISDTTQQIQSNGASVTFTSFNGATAPMETLRATLTGPWTNPRLTFADGSWVQYNGAIAAAQTLVINSDTWALTGTGITPVLSNLQVSSNSSRWITAPPTTGGFVVTLTGTARTTATQLQMVGRKKYLVG